jgi:hypothetical protein
MEQILNRLSVVLDIEIKSIMILSDLGKIFSIAIRFINSLHYTEKLKASLKN